MSNLEENMKCISMRQQNRSKKDWKLYKAMGTPMVDDLKVIIRMNTKNNNKITTDAINLATKDYGTDVWYIKGKTTKSRPMPVVRSIVEITKELLELKQDLKVLMDGLTVNSLKFLSSISQ